MKNSTSKLAVFVACVMALGLVARSGATVTVVNVDFNTTSGSGDTYVGLGAAPDAPANTTWTGIQVTGNPTSVGQNNLVASDGTTFSGVNFTLTDASSLQSYMGSGANIAPALMKDFAYIPGGTARLTLSNLSSANTYTLYVYAQNSTTANQNLTFYVDIGGSQSASAANAGNISSFQQNVNYMEFDNLTPAAGDISGYWNTGGQGINGFQLVETTIPEPSTVMLFGIGAAALWLRRRRAR